jgi:hypothetical protein
VKGTRATTPNTNNFFISIQNNRIKKSVTKYYGLCIGKRTQNARKNFIRNSGMKKLNEKGWYKRKADGTTPRLFFTYFTTGAI